MKENKTFWIARDKDGRINLYKQRPIRNNRFGAWNRKWWALYFLSSDFPEVTWENSPQQVELKLKER